jgi:hypothetical protein
MEKDFDRRNKSIRRDAERPVYRPAKFGGAQLASTPATSPTALKRKTRGRDPTDDINGERR